MYIDGYRVVGLIGASRQELGVCVPRFELPVPHPVFLHWPPNRLLKFTPCSGPILSDLQVIDAIVVTFADFASGVRHDKQTIRDLSPQRGDFFPVLLKSNVRKGLGNGVTHSGLCRLGW